MIAALFVETGGAYFMPGIDPWDEARDARAYAGPHPVVAHPPCARWGSFWYGGLLNHRNGTRKEKGADGGCFLAALLAVRRWGGVLEHPANSHAWQEFGLARPPRSGGWVRADKRGGWTCHVEQGWYGHKARKPTWLYYVGPRPSDLKWGAAPGEFQPVSGQSFHNKQERQRAIANGWRYQKRLSQKLRLATPETFRDLLISLARSSR